MNFQETCNHLFQKLASYQVLGGKALNKSLDKTLELAELLYNPQSKFKSIHIAGTNGKGSSSAMLASIYQEAGYKIGLYTSPHLKSFTERIKINGQEVEEQFVIDFVEHIQEYIESSNPSFFEITTLMAFEYFALHKVDLAIIETGLGGKLDSTNILNPEACLITNIGLDHQSILGNTLKEIGQEKAGIIKHNTPIVISETQNEIKSVFTTIAQEQNAPIYFGDESISIKNINAKGTRRFTANEKTYELGLLGKYQLKNVSGVLTIINILQELYPVSDKNIQNGLANISQNVNLKGRWQIIQENPKIICDTGHNIDGIKEIVKQLESETYDKLHIVWGMVSDKDYKKIMQFLPKNALYYFCKPNIERALNPELLLNFSLEIGLKGEIIEDVNEAIAQSIKNCSQSDVIFIGGSTFVVAEIESL